MNDGKNGTVLVVDDEADLVDLIKENLEEQGYEVLTASNGATALELISHSCCPDLIFLDMNMPVMNGWDFAIKFNDLFGRSSPIVIMTADDDSQIRAQEIGADSYLGKPFDMETLNRTVKSMIGH